MFGREYLSLSPVVDSFSLVLPTLTIIHSGGDFQLGFRHNTHYRGKLGPRQDDC